jgi:C1A family cysteine protease
VDCSSPWGNGDCANGGFYEYAFNYLKTNGMMTEAAYPYRADYGACTADSSYFIAKTNASIPYATVPMSEAPESIYSALNLKPVNVAIKADSAVFQSYSSGVITSWECGTAYNHAIAAVGYNQDNGDEPYVIVRNSWGSTWGAGGYANIGMTTGKGICGIN